MSTGIASVEEREQINQDDTALIVTGGPAARANHEFADWFSQLRFDGWETFQSLPMPVRTDEAWRFATIKALDLTRFSKPQKVGEERREDLIARSARVEEIAGRMIFANDRLLTREIRDHELQRRGVIFDTIENAVREHESIFRDYFLKQEAVLGSRKFAALHKAMVNSGAFLFVPKNVEIELPLEVFHWLDGSGGSAFPHMLIVAGENSRVTLVEYFESSDPDSANFACGVNDLHLGAGAAVNYVNVQNWSRKTLSVQIGSTSVARDANALNLNLNFGAAYARTESASRLVGEGGRSDMLAISVADGSQEFDQRTLQDHRSPNTASDLLYKNSLDDTARTIFAGLIRVEPHAHRTDAYQKVRNLLLSDDAEANSMPGLEIMADEVRCTHGATSGQIDTEEMFYLLSRGIDKDASRRLIVFGFMDEVITRLKNPAVAGTLRELLRQRFEQR
ncbi:MAG: Fe-S cluster assembly protein SufD [Verrucomicrobiota bacterium]|nr:Fe-S cluster assembly protein SufD [Verrucomicrobiota bacterium]